MKKYLEKYKIQILFFIFFLLVLFQHQFIWLYHDDYGYASLSYLTAFKTDNIGYHTNLRQIMEFLAFHYNNWGGRILCFLIECVLLRFGLWPWRIIQSLVITGIFYFVYKVVGDITKNKSWVIALVSTLMYGTFEISLLRGGLFWASASISYLFPLLPFMAFLYIYVIKEKRNIFYSIAGCLLVFAATFSQEQVSAMVISFIFFFTVYEWIMNKRINWKTVIIFIFGLIGFSILMLAPGNKVRMDYPLTADFYQLSLFGKIKQNIPYIVGNNFGYHTKIFTSLFFITAIYLAYECIKEKYFIKSLNIISLISSTVFLVMNIFTSKGYCDYLYNFFSNGILKSVAGLVLIVQVLLSFYSIALYLFNKNKILCFLLVSSIFSQLVMLVAPYFPFRSAIMFEIVMMIIFVSLFAKILNNYSKQVVLFVLLPFVIATSLNYLTITKGYYSNNKYI